MELQTSAQKDNTVSDMCEYFVEVMYRDKCRNWSDIYQHLPTLQKLSTACESVLELGVRGCVSSWAFAQGLLHNNSFKKKLICNDLNHCNIDSLKKILGHTEISVSEHWCNDLNIQLDENVDFTFIDTWHIYGQMKRELEKFGKVTNKFIAMHDTTVDAIHGEALRMGQNVQKMHEMSGFPIHEIRKGVWPAVEEFLAKEKDWVLVKRYTHNNGLTVLAKKEWVDECRRVLEL
jgi:hypothetical protein